VFVLTEVTVMVVVMIIVRFGCCRFLRREIFYIAFKFMVLLNYLRIVAFFVEIFCSS